MDTKIAAAQVYFNSKQGYGHGSFNYELYMKVKQAKINKELNEQTRDVRTDIKVCL